MISKFDLAKALRDHADIVATTEGVDITSISSSYEADPNTIFVEELVIFGVDRPVGLSDDSSDYQTGIYQLNINTPRTGTKWPGLELVDAFSAAFKKGTELVYNGQMVRVREQEVRPMTVHDTHLTHILSIVFTVIN